MDSVLPRGFQLSIRLSNRSGFKCYGLHLKMPGSCQSLKLLSTLKSLNKSEWGSQESTMTIWTLKVNGGFTTQVCKNSSIATINFFLGTKFSIKQQCLQVSNDDSVTQWPSTGSNSQWVFLFHIFDIWVLEKFLLKKWGERIMSISMMTNHHFWKENQVWKNYFGFGTAFL